jgi:hypothetical protein
MSPLAQTTRPLDSHAIATPTGVLGFVCLSAYLTLDFAVLGLLERTDFVAAMAVFSGGVLAGSVVMHLRLVRARRFAVGADASRNSLATVSLQVLVACAVLSAVALLAGKPGDDMPALAMAITALVAGGMRLAGSAADRAR